MGKRRCTGLPAPPFHPQAAKNMPGELEDDSPDDLARLAGFPVRACGGRTDRVRPVGTGLHRCRSLVRARRRTRTRRLRSAAVDRNAGFGARLACVLRRHSETTFLPGMNKIVPDGGVRGSRSTLDLRFRRSGPLTVLQHRHAGDLRTLASHHPEAAGVCHQVIVHPPGGYLGGDSLTLRVDVAEAAHALVTTPGASRIYRSLGEVTAQTVDAIISSGARLEWLPLETIAYCGCLAENRVRFRLAPGAELIAWDMLALGLPAARRPFLAGRYTQHLEVPGIWLERGDIDASDDVLLRGPGGLAGRTALATLLFARGSPLAPHQRDVLLEAARIRFGAHPGVAAAATSTHAQVIVVRALADRIEPVCALLRSVWAAWREAAWSLSACPPRVWET